MGIDFDIINDKGNLIDRYSIKWLVRYDNFFLRDYSSINMNIKNIILYCDEQIDILKLKIDKHKKIEKIKYLDFDKKKEYMVNLITNINSDEEMDGLIEKIYMIVYQNQEDCNYSTLQIFESFKTFLEKYSNSQNQYKCEISY
jgi:hypothetical protein